MSTKKRTYSLRPQQQQAFFEVFNLHTQKGKITAVELRKMLKRIGYLISKEHQDQLCQKCFELKDEISFQEFMEVFKVQKTGVDKIDILNAFNLLAGDDDKFITVQSLYGHFRKIGVEKNRIDDLMVLLQPYIENKAFNYQLFLSHLS